MEQKYSYAYTGIFVIIILLVLQFLLGIYINLYVSFPPISELHLHFPANYIIVMIHMMLGFLILIASFILMLLAIRINDIKMIISGALGFVFVIVAGLSGFIFLFNEYNIYSFLMAFSFIIVVLSEFYYLYRLSLIKK